MLPTRANYLTKAEVPGMRNPQLKLLVRVVQVTPKTMKAIDTVLGCPSKVDDKFLLLNISHTDPGFRLDLP